MKYIRIMNDGTFTHLYDENGAEIKIAASSITWTHVAREKWPVCNIQIEAVATDIDSINNRFKTINPNTGEFEEIQLIRFADGTEWSME